MMTRLVGVGVRHSICHPSTGGGAAQYGAAFAHACAIAACGWRVKRCLGAALCLGGIRRVLEPDEPLKCRAPGVVFPA